MIRDLFDEDVGYVGDDDSGRRRRIDVDHVDADAADADDDAAFEPRDDLAVDLNAPRRDQRIGVLRAGEKLRGGRPGHFDEIGDAVERFEFERVAFRDVAGLCDRGQLNCDFFLCHHADAFRFVACKLAIASSRKPRL